MATKNAGKEFEEQLEESAKKLNLFFLRIKDVHIPVELRNRIRLSQNKYDCLLYNGEVLFALELKSTASKSVSFDEKIIKQHQIDNLLVADGFKGVKAGFIFNFRDYENKTYFVPIKEFIKYKDIAENQIKEHTYKSKVNKSSISLDICNEIGIEINNYKKKVKYHYHLNDFIVEVIKLKQEGGGLISHETE
ncbi:hypothetical protein [Paenibacillus medicaginis]|uniref:Type I restriction enzyme R protein N-terminal domain-containing protein n=1 Tax=Paenibacillus medicaginis TaxID=1470560 RepID=A0ABV5BUD9_9BACL